MRTAWAAAVVAASCLLAGRAQSQMQTFFATCVAEAADLTRLPSAFAKLGMVEVDPAAGPSGPFFSQLLPNRQLWAAPSPGRGDAFAGSYAIDGGPLALCWTVSRPGLSAVAMLAELKRRFPPHRRATDRGPTSIGSGHEQWAAEAGGQQILVGVEWPLYESPESGTGYVYLAKPQQ